LGAIATSIDCGRRWTSSRVASLPWTAGALLRTALLTLAAVLLLARPAAAAPGGGGGGNTTFTTSTTHETTVTDVTEPGVTVIVPAVQGSGPLNAELARLLAGPSGALIQNALSRVGVLGAVTPGVFQGLTTIGTNTTVTTATTIGPQTILIGNDQSQSFFVQAGTENINTNTDYHLFEDALFQNSQTLSTVGGELAVGRPPHRVSDRDPRRRFQLYRRPPRSCPRRRAGGDAVLGQSRVALREGCALRKQFRSTCLTRQSCAPWWSPAIFSP
jgi:hypothetical protein